MIYNEFKGMKLSGLGLGCMRLPGLGDEPSFSNTNIDEEQFSQMVKYAIENGINYFDTAFMYHGGQSEIAVGKELAKYPRDSFYLATKFPGFQVEQLKDPKKVFETQLEKCGVDYFDFYLFHNVNDRNVDNFLNPEYGVADYLIEQKKNGRIKHLGFSTHGSLETMKKFLEALKGELEFCQIQLNYLDWSYQKAKEKVELIDSFGLPVWVMEPIRGGKLTSLPADIEAKMKAARPEASITEWGFRFVQGIPQVKMVLSGMSNMEQLKENIAVWSESKPLTEEENDMLLGSVEEMLSKITAPCTACRYCTDYCPQNLEIPQLLSVYNDGMVAGEGGFNHLLGLRDIAPDKRPENCIGCGSCASVCPQGIKIPELLADFAKKIKDVVD